MRDERRWLLVAEMVIVSPLSLSALDTTSMMSLSLGLLNLGFAKGLAKGLFGNFETYFLLMSFNSVKLMKRIFFKYNFKSQGMPSNFA